MARRIRRQLRRHAASLTTMTVGFIGLSHLGLNYSLATAAKGFDVVAYDPDPTVTANAVDGLFTIDEPGFVDLFAAHRSRLSYTSDIDRLSACELVFYALDIKTNDQNESDLGPLNALIDATASALAPGSTAVVLCQVNPGFMRGLCARLTSVSPASFYYQVETLIFGRAVERAMEPERYMVGAPDPAQPLPTAFSAWHAVFHCPVLVMRFESAELAKIAINFYLVSSVSTTNTLAEICEVIGADWNEIAPALRLDARIGPKAYLKPGLGIAGGNLERDLVTVQRISAEHGTDTGIVAAWQHNSRYRKDWALRSVHQHVLAYTPAARLAVWGLAYKQDTHSIKNSPSIACLQALPHLKIAAYDPAAQLPEGLLPNVDRLPRALDVLVGADALVILTPWDEFSQIAPAEIARLLHGKIVLDPYGLLDPAEASKSGLQVHQLGRSPTT